MNMCAYFQSTMFRGVRAGVIRHKAVEMANRLHGGDDRLRGQIMAFADYVGFERYGVLEGDYIADESGLFLIDRAGQHIMINCSWEDMASQQLLSHCYSESIQWKSMDLLAHWDQLELYEDWGVLGHAYSNNYFHFTCDVIGAARLLAKMSVRGILTPAAIKRQPFQAELLNRALPGKPMRMLERPVRVRNPVLALVNYAEETIHYLRHIVPHRPTSGNRRLYIPRTSSSRSTVPGGICQTPEFVDVLQRHNFEVMDFGAGGKTVSEQINMLNGARVIVSAHGAALTNLAYCQPGTSVIEIVGSRTSWAVYAALSNLVGLDHHIIASKHYDSQGNIIIDAAELDQILTSIL